MQTVGAFAIPTVIVLIVLFGLVRKINVFSAFLDGAKQSISSTIVILPSLVGLIMAVTIMKESGAIDLIVKLLSPIASLVGIPKDVMPIAILNPISGSGSLAMYESILKSFGPDSYVGRVASVMMGATETTFYAVTLYYGSVGVKNTGYTIPAAILADITSYISSSFVVKLFFK